MDTGVERTRDIPQQITVKTDTRDILARETMYRRQKGFLDWTIVDVDAHHSEMSSWREVTAYLEDPTLGRWLDAGVDGLLGIGWLYDFCTLNGQIDERNSGAA